MSPERERIRIRCNNCGRVTNHELYGEHVFRENDEYGFWEEVVHRLWICAGCETGTLQVAATEVGQLDSDGSQMYDYLYYPPRNHRSIREKRFRRLPKHLQAIYAEAVRAYNQDLHVLCAGGLRALIEGICQEKKVTGKTLQKRIDGLVAVLPDNIVRSLHSFRFMGNIALHELSAPERRDLRLAIEVSEDLLNYLYDLDYKASRLAKSSRAAEK